MEFAHLVKRYACVIGLTTDFDVRQLAEQFLDAVSERSGDRRRSEGASGFVPSNTYEFGSGRSSVIMCVLQHTIYANTRDDGCFESQGG
jgi:hypothetical protein